jgi:polar amino acid transport system ATP-binding protein
LIQVKKLNKSFGGVQVLKDVNFKVEESEVVVFIGASGSGKSTLLRCLNFLEKPDGGEIWFKGKKWSRKKRI